ncbi:Uncharacterised protein [Streptococcus pneumoniae]|mgnify:FL=1|jgi:hypothetical protein|nr:Uncharacterised protein [Streptococcus pneumoniae]CVU77328.1 Uncharacterised protein [Streptococcus pneumoniae]CWC21247.1 Uncharacterised protein [Streptococcus pneumoniae]DAK95958.1 MAG TPA: hypothetical protein [Caudoviricetes sp.]DAR81790.1 MAG TPA: hypothetical protein [Caudoviricetes sp.]
MAKHDKKKKRLKLNEITITLDLVVVKITFKLL